MLISEMGLEEELFLQSGYWDNLEFIKSGGEGELGDKVVCKRVRGQTAVETKDM